MLRSSSEESVLLKVNEVAKMLNISRSTLWALRKNSPDFPKPIKILGECQRFKRSDILHYIEQLNA